MSRQVGGAVGVALLVALTSTAPTTAASRLDDQEPSGIREQPDRQLRFADADPEQLAYTLAAAFQGGMLLDQSSGNAEPLRAALNGAIAYIETFAARDSMS
jgi:hypothetical protein